MIQFFIIFGCSQNDVSWCEPNRFIETIYKQIFYYFTKELFNWAIYIEKKFNRTIGWNNLVEITCSI